MNIQRSIIEPICTFIIIGGIILGIQLGYVYFLISALSLLVLIITNKRKKKIFHQLYIKTLKDQWGKDHKEKRDFLNIRKLYDLFHKEEYDNFTIDDITWRDLNMDSVFCKIDHTKSFPGMQYLYNILRNPIFNENILKERNDTINLLLRKKDIAQEIQYPLSMLGKKQTKEILLYFKDGFKIKTNPLILYRLLSCFSYISIVLLFINRQLGFAILMGVIAVNASIYQSNKYKIEEEIETFRYISSLVKCAERIVKIDTGEIDINKERLVSLLKQTKQIYKNVSALNTNSSGSTETQIIVDYINMITLREAIIFYKTINLINKHKSELFAIYNHIGMIDAYISIASYKDGLKYYTEPSLIKDNTRFYLKTEEIYHPLLDKPVPYSFEFNNRGALITGSNASGKSTYLRTIGINALFAQTFSIALAKNYSANYFKLLTSIGTTDSIVEGDSYFMAEAKSLKRIIDILDTSQPVLCILDEIFRGTNTAERISAATEVLNYMIDNNSLVVAATHDLELTSIVNDKFNNYHFRETIEENDIKFDYILRHGPATSRNAIAILKYLGYPKEIYENSNNRVEEYEIIKISKMRS